MRIAILLFFATASAALACEHPYILHRAGDTSGCADSRDFKRVEHGGDVFWFARNGHDYFVRDAATLDRLEQLFEPQRALGKQQGALGRQQGELGRRQAAIGRQQADADHEQQRELSRQQRELATEQRALGAKQHELGKRQAELAHELDRQLQTIEDDLIRNGSARAE